MAKQGSTTSIAGGGYDGYDGCVDMVYMYTHTYVYIYVCVYNIYIYSIKYIIIWNDIIVCQIMSHYSKKCASRVRIDK